MMSLFAAGNLYWYLPPLVIAVSLVYSERRYEAWRLIFSHALLWTVYLLTFLAASCAVLWVLSLDIHPYWLIPMLLVVVLALVWPGRRKKSQPEQGNG